MQSYQGERWGRREQLNMSHWGGQLQQFLGSEGRKFGQSQQDLFNPLPLPSLPYPPKVLFGRSLMPELLRKA